MIYFTTEFEITLPTDKESNIYSSKVMSIIEDFLGDIAYKYKNSIAVKYICGRIKNKFEFKWNDSIYGGTETGAARVKAASKTMERFLKSDKYLKKHNISNIMTEYVVK